MLVTGGERATAVAQGEQVDDAVRVRECRAHFAIYPQARDAAIGKYVQSQV